jgi:hypothetical protein
MQATYRLHYNSNCIKESATWQNSDATRQKWMMQVESIGEIHLEFSCQITYLLYLKKNGIMLRQT